MKMTTQITTLEQARIYLMNEGVVNFGDMTVEGRQLLEVCGATSQPITRQIEKHNFVEGVDFTKEFAFPLESSKESMWYEFSVDAAAQVLLAASTAQEEQPRQEDTNTQVAVSSNEELRQMVLTVIQSQKDIIQLQEDILALLESRNVSLLKDEGDLITKEPTLLPLSKLLGNGSSKVVQSANLWLEDEGYQVMRFEDGEPAGWELTDKGRNLGTQVNPSSIFWIPEIKIELPATHTLLEFAERLGLRDMKAQA